MELIAQKREIFGRAVKPLRAKGFVPAELYGRGLENLHLAVSKKELSKVFKQAGENGMVTLLVDQEKRPVLIHDLQLDPVTDEALSVDFYQVRLDEKIKIKVPVEFIGIASAVKDKSGILVKAVQEVEVEALPADIPHSIPVNLESLIDIGKSIRLKDLAIQGDFKFLIEPETVLATITAPVTEEKEAELAQAVDLSTVKVESEEKKADRDAKKAEEGVAKTPAAETPAKPAKPAK